MKWKFYHIINFCYIIAIPTWWFALSASMGFETGFEFGQRDEFNLDNEFWNLAFFFLAAVVLTIIGLVLIKKYSKNRKSSALYLGTYNLVFAVASGYEAMRKFILFNEQFDAAREVTTFVLISWALIYYMLFMQEIFRGNSKFENHKKSQGALLLLVIASDFILFLYPFIFTGKKAADWDIGELPKYIAFGILGVTVIILSVWQIRASFRLVQRSKDPDTRIGITMIGVSAIVYLAVIASIILKESVVIFDAVLPLLVFVVSITTYLGYVYPSRKQKMEPGD